MKNVKQNNAESNIIIQSLSGEISEKSVLMAKQNAQIYKLAAENQKLKKQLKSKNGSKK